MVAAEVGNAVFSEWDVSVVVVVVESVQNYKGMGFEKIVVVIYARFVGVYYARMKDEIEVVGKRNDIMGRYYYYEKREKKNYSGSKNSKRTEEVV